MRLVFAGTPEFAARALAALLNAGHDVALVVTMPDRAAGRGMRPAASSVKRLADQHGLAVYQPSRLGEPEAQRLAASRPEALIVAAYGALLPPALLELAPLGALNIHASLLPRWRGAAPIQRALLAGDAETGISIMRMDAGLDTGPVLAQYRLPIAKDDDAGTLHDKLAALGSEAIVATLEALRTGKATARAQPVEGITYARKIGRDDTVIQWTRPAVELERVVRALRPSPGAGSTVRGEWIKIWRAHVVDARGVPGTLLAVGDALVVACGEGALALTELQRAGGRRLSSAEFLRGRALAVGSRLG